MRQQLRASALLVTIGMVGLAGTAFGAEGAGAARVTVASTKSFDEVTDAVKSLVAKNGMMVMAEVNQGQMLSMTGLTVDATVFLVGNPTVGKQLFEQNHAVGLYVPLRIAVYTDTDGKTYVQYDKPSTLLGQFENEHITTIAQMLDERIGGLATMATQ